MSFEDFEKQAIARGYSYPVGVDEAGRGPLAGPVVAAAFYVAPDTDFVEGVTDSKKLSSKKRASLYKILTSNPNIQFAIATVSHEEIDALNILQASLQAMLEAVSKLAIPVDYIFVDGNKKINTKTACEAIIKGDSKVYSIAAASIIAKEYRDALMEEYDLLYPEYRFAKHKGYPTKEHLELLQKYGPSPIHRLTFGKVGKVYA